MTFKKSIIAASLFLSPMAFSSPMSQLQNSDSTVEKVRYIVTLKESAMLSNTQTASQFNQTLANQISLDTGVSIAHIYQGAISGFVVDADSTQLNALKQHQAVENVLLDNKVTIEKTFFDDWGIARIDQRDSSFNTSYDPYNTGAGVIAYILDTGVQLSNPHIAPLLYSNGFSADTGEFNGDDCDGHGTSVASLVSSERFGVAKETQLVPVSIYANSDLCGIDNEQAYRENEEVHLSKVVEAIDFIWQDATSHGKPSVVNISFTWWVEGPKSHYYELADIELMESALQHIIEAGITVVAGAGNDQHDACWNSPARMEDVITVGAVDKDDRAAIDLSLSHPTMNSFSNYGDCVDIFAPGVSVSAASIRYNSTPFSGTSAASPFVTGGAALALSDDPTLTPRQVKAKLIEDSTKNSITGLEQLPLHTVNRVLYVGPDAAGETCEQDPTQSKCSFEDEQPPVYEPYQPNEPVTEPDQPYEEPVDCDFSPEHADCQISTSLSFDTPIILSGAEYSVRTFEITVPEDAQAVTFTTSGGTGDADIFVKYNGEATKADNDCASISITSDEECVLEGKAGTYTITIYGYDAYTDINLIVTMNNEDEQPSDNQLIDGETLSGISLSQGEVQYFTIEVPSGNTLSVATLADNGDADIYVGYNQIPTVMDYACKSNGMSSNEACDVNNTQGGTYHILLKGYSATTDLSLTASIK